MEVWGGIECTINRVGDEYFDQVEYQNHLNRAEDIDVLIDLGIKRLRYPFLWEKHQPQLSVPASWHHIEAQLDRLKNSNIEIIAGLVHHGCGPNYVNVLDDSFAEGLAGYAGAVARKFPWIEYYTPVNEPLTTARFSCLYGHWYPHRKDDYSFFKMLINECKATILAMKAIRKINPTAKLVQTEDLGKIHSSKNLVYQANFENNRRWLSIDLLCGYVNRSHPLWNSILNSGVDEDDLSFFLSNAMPPDIIGFNYYITSERYIDEQLDLYPEATHGGNGIHSYADVEAIRTGKTNISGPGKLLKEAWERYHLPLAITEAQLNCGREDQLRWWNYIMNEVSSLPAEGINFLAVTAWSLFGCYGWDRLLTAAQGNYEAGAFDIRSGKPRSTALAKLIKATAKNVSYQHPTLSCPGWWERPSRVLYAPEESKTPDTLPINCKPLLIIGATGTLGGVFKRTCEERGLAHRSLSRQDLNLEEADEIENAILKFKPWAIINAAGFVRVDDAENEQENCYLSNTTGPVNLAKKCEQYGVKLLTFSSDLVFDGKKEIGYYEDDEVNPLNIYGKSKAIAEERILLENPSALVIRTSAFFSPWDPHNFVFHVLSSLRNERPLNLASDTFISPTYVPDLAHACLDLAIDDESGIWHLANDGSVSWFELAKEVAVRASLNASLIRPTSSSKLGYTAKRPKFSVLKTRKGIFLPKLENALDRYFNEIRL